MMGKVLIIYTGGTIGMTKSSKGYAPADGDFEDTLKRIPELYDSQMPSWELIQLSPVKDSSNMDVHDWNRIAEMIENHYEQYDGFVILHGTDTMAYTASALSFMLEELSKPVILTGSQIPLCEIRNDARDNLITSIVIAAQGVVNEVCIFFGGSLIRGNRSTKYSSDGLIAFLSPNYPALAEAAIDIQYNYPQGIKESHLPRQLHVQYLLDVPIAVIKVFPGIKFKYYTEILNHNFRGIVIETFGAGNIPGGAENIEKAISAKDNDTIYVICSQCPAGSVSLGQYETSTILQNAEGVSGLDMTTEAAMTKLYYLISKGYERSEIIDLMEKNLRGEIRSD